MTEVRELAGFVERARLEDMSTQALEQLKIRVLDTIGVAVGATAADPMRAIRELTSKLGGERLSTLIGGGQTAPDRAAFYNGALSRYLDFMDSYVAEGETCHPSDNFAPVLAAAEMRQASGAEFLAALAVAYQVQTRLCDVAPVRDRGFDHTAQGAYAAAAGVANALGLRREQIANALAISGTANNALRVTRTGALSHWKGLAYANMAMAATHEALLAAYGITGPEAVFEGNKGFKETISGPFEIDWRKEGLESVKRTILKKHNAEIHAQTAVEAALEIRASPAFSLETVSAIRLETFGVAYQIIGGGEEGEKHSVGSKEQADHSLPYMLAVALIDGKVQPEQFTQERIASRDVQDLLRKVTIVPDPLLSAMFPARLPARLEVRLVTGVVLQAFREDYPGFHTAPFDWATTQTKFKSVIGPFASQQWGGAVARVVESLDERPLADLTTLLASLSISERDDLQHW